MSKIKEALEKNKTALESQFHAIQNVADELKDLEAYFIDKVCPTASIFTKDGAIIGWDLASKRIMYCSIDKSEVKPFRDTKMETRLKYYKYIPLLIEAIAKEAEPE